MIAWTGVGPQSAVLLVGVAVAVVAPLLGAALAASGRAERHPRRLAVAAAATALVGSLAAALAWAWGERGEFAAGPALGGGRLLFVDGVSALFLPYVALVGTAILLVAPRRGLDAPSVRRTLLSLGSTLALFVTSHPLLLVVLWGVTARLTWRSTRVTPGGGPAARVYGLYAAVALACMAAGTLLLVVDPPWDRSSGIPGIVGGWLVAVAVTIRKGIVPFHSWYPALFEGAPMATALLATMPHVAAYTAVRLLVGHADGVPHELEMLSVLALATSVWGAALALVQRDLRGFVGHLAMSQSAIILAGLSGTLAMELNGAFCVWISSGLAITGIGLVAWAIESRAGPIRLDTLQGRFRDAPELAAFFLLFGMAAIGLPGTLSFVADDLIVTGLLDDHIGAGLCIIVSTVLSGIAVMRCWFHVFGGGREVDAPRHAVLPRERVSLAVLLAVLFGLGLWPGPLVEALERAAAAVLRSTPSDARPAVPGGAAARHP